MSAPIVSMQEVYEYHAALLDDRDPAPTQKTAAHFGIGARHVRRLIETHRLYSRVTAHGWPATAGRHWPHPHDLEYSVLIAEIRHMRDRLDIVLDMLTDSR